MFEVVFSGKIIEGGDLSAAKNNIAALFKVSDTQLDKLFSGQRVVIKSGLDEATAQKYQQAIYKAGALCEVLALATEVTPPSPASAEAVPASQITENEPGIAPVGTILSPSRPEPTPPVVNIDHITTAEVGSDLGAIKEVVQPAIALENLNFDIAPAGSDLGEIPRDLPPAVISDQLDGVSVEPAGADLALPKSPIAPPVNADIDFPLAPAGSDLGQLKKDQAPPPPDTSHLSLESEPE